MALGNRTNVHRYQVRTLEDIKNHVDITGECWLWTGSKSDGYGKVYMGSQWEPAQVTVWRIAHPGERVKIPRQTCGRRACVNPKHFAGEASEAIEDQRVVARSAARGKSREAVKVRARGLCEICGKPETRWMERAHLFGRGRKGIVGDALADQPEFSVWAHVGCHRRLDASDMRDQQEAMRWRAVGLMAGRYGLTPPFAPGDPEWDPRRAAGWIEQELKDQGFLRHRAGRGWVLEG